MPDTITPTQARGTVAYDASSAIVLTGQAQRALAGAADFVVDSPDMMDAAADDLRAVKGLQKNVEAQRTTITAPLNQVLRAVNDLFRPAGEFLAQAEAKLKGAMLTYTTEQQRLAEEARRKAEAEAAAERARLADEQRRQDAIARQAAQDALAAERAASEAAARGDAAAAAAAQEQARVASEAAQQADIARAAAEVTAAVVSMPVEIAAPAKVSGISTSKSIDFVVEDLQALIRHVAANPALVGLLVPDTVRLRAQVRATGMQTQLPGVRVFVKQSMSARA